MIITPPDSGHPTTLTAAERPTPLSARHPEPGAATVTGDDAAPSDPLIAERCAWSLVWLGVTIGGIGLFGSWSAWSPGGLAAPVLVVAGIAGVAASWVVGTPRARALQLSALGSVVLATLVGQGLGIHTRRYYSTDSAAFNHVAARLVLNGVDPYTATMAAAGRLLQNPADFWTYTVSGGHVDHVSYPAGSFLVALPAMALGFRHGIVDWMDLFAWIAAAVLIFAFLPVAVRWVAPLLLLTTILSGVFGSGGTDAAFLPFLVLAVWRWDRFGLDRSEGLARWMGPVALGLACSIKQSPWFCIPFVAVGLFLEARHSGRRPWPLVGRYVAIVVGVFGVVNLPFIVWQPAAWARGTFLPLHVPLVADGQGLVTVTLHGIARGVSLPLLTVAGAFVLLALLAAMVVWYPVVKRIWLLLLPLAFFVAPRSLFTYMLDFYPAALVAALTVRSVAPSPTPGAIRRRVHPVWAVATPAVAAVAVMALAFASAPLDVAVRSVRTSDAATSLDAVTVNVDNTTDQTVTPHFMVEVGSGHPVGFWHPSHGGPLVLGPHESAVVTLWPPGHFDAPAHDTNWLVEAYTTSPEALSTSPLMYWRLGAAQ